MNPQTAILLLFALWCAVVLGDAGWLSTRRTLLQKIGDNVTSVTHGLHALTLATNRASAAFIAWGVAEMESFRRLYRQEGAIYGDTEEGFTRWCNDRRARYGGYLLPS